LSNDDIAGQSCSCKDIHTHPTPLTNVKSKQLIVLGDRQVDPSTSFPASIGELFVFIIHGRWFFLVVDVNAIERVEVEVKGYASYLVHFDGMQVLPGGAIWARKLTDLMPGQMICAISFTRG
jgi:hypothetical protein